MELVILIILFIVGGLIQSAAQRQRRQRGGTVEAPPDQGEPESPDLMAEIRKAIEQLKDQREVKSRPTLPGRRQLPGAGRTAERRPAVPAVTEEDDVEEVESLEVGAEVVSLEQGAGRVQRVRVDQDDEAEALVTRRHQWAEDHSRPLGKADHRSFDQRIRAQPAPAPSPIVVPEADRIAKLRRLIIWQEVLGKPLGLRDRDRL